MSALRKRTDPLVHGRCPLLTSLALKRLAKCFFYHFASYKNHALSRTDASPLNKDSARGKPLSAAKCHGRTQDLQLTRTQSLPFEVVVKEHRVVPARPVQGQLQDSDQHGQRVAVRNTMQPAGREKHNVWRDCVCRVLRPSGNID
jgi:hypothetical protein